jgi:spermidine/putrescine transport system permease protein
MLNQKRIRHPMSYLTWLVTPACVWLLIFLVLPMLIVLVYSLWESTITGIHPMWGLQNYKRFFEGTLYVGLLARSLSTAIFVTILTILIGYPVAYFVARKAGRHKTIYLILVLVPFWTSYLLRNFAWMPVLGTQGVLNKLLVGLGILAQPSPVFLYSKLAVYIGFVHTLLPYLIVPVYVSIEALDPRLIEAAKDLGASKIRALLHITVPLSMPGIISGSIIVFVNVAGAYVTPKLLGGSSGIMYGNTLADQFSATYDLPFGSALSLILMVFVVLGIGLLNRFASVKGLYGG